MSSLRKCKKDYSYYDSGVERVTHAMDLSTNLARYMKYALSSQFFSQTILFSSSTSLLECVVAKPPNCVEVATTI